ncbi:E3 SUMO-protein ligase ZBED1-like isoform X2 [Drosophila mojavensis]|uniref:E3 SUMO-protein ligase ZBED1-like isoform X2 n=1 Tax=Drosophila mojavensis TaxID=7230 RepID=UPI001CD13FE7|nr:E3 SUMO-protein ligase ZBED1-like isoform X2 [Drosophila mojavensis]
MDKFLKSKDNGEDCDADKENGEEEIPRKRTKYGMSGVWDYFKKCADGKTAKCTKCGQICQTSGNTTNLSAHLIRKHPNLSTIEESKAAGPISTLLQKKYDASSARKKTLDSALTTYITSDRRPYCVVEDKGFRHLVEVLDPRYQLPSRRTLRDVCIPNLFIEMKQKLREILDKIEFCAVTTDGWTSKANENYLSVSCHFITEEFEMRTAVLSTTKLKEETNHSAQNIAIFLRAVP